MPEVKKFLKEKGGVDMFEDVKVEWVKGAEPVLNIFDEAGKVKEKIQLAPYTCKQLKTLFARHFPLKEPKQKHSPKPWEKGFVPRFFRRRGARALAIPRIPPPPPPATLSLPPSPLRARPRSRPELRD